LGEDAARQVWSLARWSEAHLGDVLAAREIYDTTRA
jgi:hypothetical protein